MACKRTVMAFFCKFNQIPTEFPFQFHRMDSTSWDQVVSKSHSRSLV